MSDGIDKEKSGGSDNNRVTRKGVDPKTHEEWSERTILSIIRKGR